MMMHTVVALHYFAGDFVANLILSRTQQCAARRPFVLRPSSHVYIVLQFLRNRCRHFDITYPLPWLFPNNKYLYIQFHVRQRVCPVCCCCCCRCDSNPPGPTVFRAMGFIITIIHNTSSLQYTIRTDRTNERTGALSRL